MNARTSRLGFRTPYYVLTAGLAIVFLYPLIWTTVSSVSPQPGSAQVEGLGFNNYATLASYQAGLPHYLGNSLAISLVAVGVTLLAATFGGYAFARFSFPGKNALFLVTLSILMVPYATLLIPLTIWLKTLGLNNTLVGVGLVLAVFQLPFATFMMRISFEGVPKEIEEAALMDGCGSFGALRRVLVHAVKPGLITIGLFAFLAAWNDFMVPLFLVGGDNQPLPLALVNMRQQVMGVIDYGSTQAGVVVLTIPCVLLFLLLQRHYVNGFMSGALKG
ncbi:carbohydrate ABC transporter permease [Serinibacter arcticus]|uniref:ABC-type sugar transport system, permease component n=1 Tax=Serinibacter arcticus TaxID=1655435 RepID=A0A4Z1E3B3_9MICO|nr:carbohydrate ABC transporter permease [Serinibacter arcticus]TGO05750.1 ABC-type sugar transport system, permease component [Serinibacter arcticus]